MSKLQVISKKDGFRRAGFTFREQEPTIIDIETLPEDTRDATVKAIKEEPMLVVIELADDGTETQISKDDGKILLKTQKELDKATTLVNDQLTRIRDLQSQLEASLSEVTSLSDRIKAADDVAAGLNAQIDNLTAQLTAANDELATLKADAGSTSKKK